MASVLGSESWRQNQQREGIPCGSLDDCHTNVYALTELSEIRWRVYEHTTGGTSTTRLHEDLMQDDPIVKAYGRCLQKRLLCAFRRQPQQMGGYERLQLPVFDKCAKELWIFWFTQDEPSSMASCVDGLIEKQQASMMDAQIISPEVRHMFFNALYTYLSNGFVKSGHLRFGRWHTKPLKQPLPGREHMLPRFSIGYNLRLFIAGISTVCCAVISQKQPALFRLTRQHIELKEQFKVILAPWSIRAVFIGTDISAYKIDVEAEFKKWKQYWFPHWDEDGDEPLQQPGVPLMVLVEADQMPLLYPSCMIGVTWDECPLRYRSSTKRTQAGPTDPLDHFLPYPHDQIEIQTKGIGERNRTLISQADPWPVLQLSMDEAMMGKKKSQESGWKISPIPAVQKDDEKFAYSDGHRSAHCDCNECNTRLGKSDVENPEDILLPDDRFRKKLQRKAERSAQYQEGRRKIREIENIYNNPSEAEKCPYDITVLKAVLEQLSEKERDLMLQTTPTKEKEYREKKRKQKRYSRLNAESSSLLPHFAPFPSSSSDEDSEEENERSNPSWSNTKCADGIHTGIYCNADGAVYHFPDPLNSPGNSSDDDSYETIPFTPVRVVSPCYPKGKYCGRNSPIKSLNDHLSSDSHPPTTSYHSRKMHSRKSGKDRRKRLPVIGSDLDKITAKQTADLISLHKTRTAQLADKWPYLNQQIVETRSSSPEDQIPLRKETSRTTRPKRNQILSKRKDVTVRGRIRGGSNRLRRHSKGSKQDWPSCEIFDVSNMARKTKEDYSMEMSELFDVPQSFNDLDSERESGDEGNADGKETRFLLSIFDGTKDQNQHPTFQYNASVSGYPQDEAMSADECMMAIQVGAGPPSAPSDFLSPPASNEGDDHLAPGSVAPFPRGPPSVPLTDAQMNNIYPTPPSVLVDTQQPSPQQLSIPSTSTQIQSSLSVDPIDVQMIELLPPILSNLPKQKASTSKSEKPWKDEQIDDEIYPNDLGQDIGEVVNFVKEHSIHAKSRWNELPKAMRYAAFGQIKLRAKINRLPDYEKTKSRINRGGSIGKKEETAMEKLAAALNNRQMGQQGQNGIMGIGRMSGAHQMNAMRGGAMGPAPPGQLRMSYGGMGHPVQQLNTLVYGGIGGYQGMAHGGMQPHMGGGMGIAGPMHPPQMGITHPPHMGPGMGPGGQMMGGNGQMGASGSIGMQNMYYRGNPHQGGYGGGMGGDPINGSGYNPMGNLYGAPYQPAPSHGHPTYGAPPMPPHMLQRQSSVFMNSPQTHSSVPTPSSNVSSQHPSTPLIVKQELPDPEQDQENQSSSLLPSLPLSLLLSDTILNLHYDSTFDSCPICSCNSSIRARELGLYIASDEILRNDSQTQQSLITPWSGFYIQNGQLNPCTCGFSAIRYRLLSMRSGLFPEDAREATGDVTSVAEIESGLGDADPIWFNIQTPQRQEGKEAMNMLDLVRRMSLHRDISTFISRSGSLHDSLNKSVKSRSEKESNEYVISMMDQTELLLIWSAAVGSLMPSGKIPSNDDVSTYFHPWGLQTAKEMFDVGDAECRSLLNELKTSLDESMRYIRNGQPTQSIVEGPLTWRTLSQKCVKSSQDDEKECLSTAEPIPCLMVAGERENAPIRASPSIVRFWEAVSLGPIDQPKDVFYLAITYDDPDLSEKTANYFEEMSRKYEQMRLGKHLQLPANEQIVKGGVMRIERSANNTNNIYAAQSSLLRNISLYNQQKGGYYDPLLLQRLQYYCAQLEQSLINILTKDNCAIFDRETFRRAATEQYRSRCYLMSYFAKSTEDRLRVKEREAQLERNEIFRKSQLEKLVVDMDQIDQQADDGRETRKSGGETDKDPETALDAMQELMDMPDMRQEDPKNEQIDGQINQGMVQLGQPQPPMTPQKNGMGQDGGYQTGNQPGSSQQNPHNAHSTRTTYLSSYPGGIPGPIPEVPALPPEDIPDDEPGLLPHVIVVYLIDPFSTGERSTNPHISRLIAQAYIRTFNNVCQKLPTKWRCQVQLEIVPSARLMDHYASYAQVGRSQFDHVEKYSAQDCLRDLCLSVYSQSRVVLPECVKTILPKSMTKFGPASQLSEAIEGYNGNHRELQLFQISSNPWHLAPSALLHKKADGQMVTIEHEEQSLYVTYCLLGGEWLCASITDSLGKIQDNCLINMKPNNPEKMVIKYRKRTQILDAMDRLWTYIQGNLVVGTKCWRLVVGKLGRIGHAEFRAWSTLLSKTNLKKQNQKLKENCQSCQFVAASCPILQQSTPIILSACLVSIEPEPNLKVLPTSLSHSDAKNRTRGSAVGPEDGTVTHILVFPTSVDVQFGATDNLGQAHEDDDNLNLDFEIGFDDLGEMGEMKDLINEVIGSENGPPQTAGIRNPHGGFFDNFETQIENQPLAIGFYISTAPAPDLPEWFWASCPNARGQTPVHLKSSLHINVTQVQQDDSFGNVQKDKNSQGESDAVHPLDSNRTDEVLRHVLETYNALSWLSIDSLSGERRSCLPVHMQSLLRLYHSVARFIL
ncbi:unnamed protein product, partial [Mesorhabditis belari]|uniref:Mediator of RNA polymerase II transcription subunit 13 n=1 Tax=Mesorhabditis belari TaxID=2138241 RepID=A0AAF3F045_9BILA